MIRLISYSAILILLAIGCTEQKTDSTNSNENNTVLGEISFKVPEDWKSEQPKSQMRKAQYRVPGVDGAQDAEMAVFVFPGTGGSVQANIDRWVGQFVQPDGSDSGEKSETKKMIINNLPVTIIYLTGTYLASASPMMMGGPKVEKTGYAMLAAIVETSKDPWFFKMVGPQQTIDHRRPEFDKFVNSFE